MLTPLLTPIFKDITNPHKMVIQSGTQGRTRTDTVLLLPDFESSVSTISPLGLK